jgi:phenylalanyl-tRNA synthetase beta subunit
MLALTPLLKSVDLTDIYGDNYTFHYTYQSPNQALSNQDIAPWRQKIVSAMKKRGCPLVGSL